MYQARRVAGLDRPDVQLTWTRSPIWYRRRDPVMVGPWSGNANEKENNYFRAIIMERSI